MVKWSGKWSKSGGVERRIELQWSGLESTLEGRAQSGVKWRVEWAELEGALESGESSAKRNG